MFGRKINIGEKSCLFEFETTQASWDEIIQILKSRAYGWTLLSRADIQKFGNDEFDLIKRLKPSDSKGIWLADEKDMLQAYTWNYNTSKMFTSFSKTYKFNFIRIRK